MLQAQDERLARRYHLQAQGIDFDKIVDRVADVFSLKPAQVLSSTKNPERVMARSLLCYWAVKELEISGAKVSRKLKVTKSTVNRSIARGEKISHDMKLNLIEN